MFDEMWHDIYGYYFVEFAHHLYETHNFSAMSSVTVFRWTAY